MGVTGPGVRGGDFAKINLKVCSISFLPRTRPVGAAAEGGKNMVASSEKNGTNRVKSRLLNAVKNSVTTRSISRAD